MPDHVGGAGEQLPFRYLVASVRVGHISVGVKMKEDTRGARCLMTKTLVFMKCNVTETFSSDFDFLPVTG